MPADPISDMSSTHVNPIRLTSRVERIQPSPTMAVMNRATELSARGIDVVDFGPGEPDFRTPDAIGEAAAGAIADGFTRYTNTAGTRDLRCAIADRYRERWGTAYGAENVIAASGGKQALFNAILALIEDGDEVIIPVPYWVSFPDQVLFAGGVPVFAPLDSREGLRPRVVDIEPLITDRTRIVIINSPCNPSGAVIAPEELEGIVRLCGERGIVLIYDETYEFFVYGSNQHVSAAKWYEQYPESVVIVNSLSKTFAMTGWRLGWALAHPALISAMTKIQSHSTSNPTSISQVAALRALDGCDDDVRRMYEAYVERRAWLVPALNAISGIECLEPDGAFYVFPRVSGLFREGGFSGSFELCSWLLDEARVAAVPGDAFGSDEFVRISYATSMERLEEGVRRIRNAVERLNP